MITDDISVTLRNLRASMDDAADLATLGGPWHSPEEFVATLQWRDDLATAAVGVASARRALSPGAAHTLHRALRLLDKMRWIDDEIASLDQVSFTQLVDADVTAPWRTAIHQVRNAPRSEDAVLARPRQRQASAKAMGSLRSRIGGLAELRNSQSSANREDRVNATNRIATALSAHAEEGAHHLANGLGAITAVGMNDGWLSHAAYKTGSSAISLQRLDEAVGTFSAQAKDTQIARARLFGATSCDDADRHAPITKRDTWTVEEARTVSVQTLTSLDPRLGEHARRIWEARRLELLVGGGRAQRGAHTAVLSPDHPAQAQVPFDGSTRAVACVVHELTHIVHADLASKQPLASCPAPRVVAETMALFAEQRFWQVFATPAESVNAALVATCEALSLHTFVAACHDGVADQVPLTSEWFAETWMRTRQTYDGAVTYNDRHRFWWMLHAGTLDYPSAEHVYPIAWLTASALGARVGLNPLGASFAQDLFGVMEAGAGATLADVAQLAGAEDVLTQGAQAVAEQMSSALSTRVSGAIPA